MRACVDIGIDVLDERGGLLAVRGVQAGLLHLRVRRRPEGVGEHDAAGDQQQIAEKAKPRGPRAPAPWCGGRRRRTGVARVHSGMVPAAREGRHNVLDWRTPTRRHSTCDPATTSTTSWPRRTSLMRSSSCRRRPGPPSSPPTCSACPSASVVKSLLFVLDDERPVLALVTGDATVDADALARETGAAEVAAGSRSRGAGDHRLPPRGGLAVRAGHGRPGGRRHRGLRPRRSCTAAAGRRRRCSRSAAPTWTRCSSRADCRSRAGDGRRRAWTPRRRGPTDGGRPSVKGGHQRMKWRARR